MYIRIFCSICCICISFAVQAQLCGTTGPDTTHVQRLPWYGNPSFLTNYLDSTHCCSPSPSGFKTNGFGGVTPATVRIPIQFILANDDNGNRPLEFWELEEITRLTNEFHNNAGSGIQFYIRCGIVEFNADSLNTDISTTNTSNLYDLFQSGDAIDVFVIQSSVSNWVGIANFPSDPHPYQTIITGDQTTRTLLDIAATLCHEIGHCLDLLHTHHPNQSNKSANHECRKCRQESVDRTKGNGILCNNTGTLKCSIHGDILCDTEADPLLSIAQNVNITNCTYNGPGNTGNIPDEDNWGDEWTPDVRNVMSYAGPCRNTFSPMQSAVQRITAQNAIPDVSQLPINDFDVFEPDNTPESAQELLPGQAQCHTFHFSGGTEEQPLTCDEDWLAFSTLNFGSVRIKTWGILYKPDPDTELNLFDANLNLVANNDNFGSSNYAWIDWVNLPSGDYFVQIINNSVPGTPESRGHYNVDLTLAPPVSRSKPVALEHEVKIFPNPADGIFQVQMDVDQPGKMSIQIFTPSGAEVTSAESNVVPGEVFEVDASHLPRGLYFLKVHFEGRQANKKILLW